jgi:hypothetical protein
MAAGIYILKFENGYDTLVEKSGGIKSLLTDNQRIRKRHLMTSAAFVPESRLELPTFGL